MTKRYTEAKAFVQRARQRLLNNDYKDYEKRRENAYYINNRPLTKDQISAMDSRVDEILASDTLVYDALSRLIVDYDDFFALDETDRLKYMLELSKIYAVLRAAKNSEP